MAKDKVLASHYLLGILSKSFWGFLKHGKGAIVGCFLVQLVPHCGAITPHFGAILPFILVQKLRIVH